MKRMCLRYIVQILACWSASFVSYSKLHNSQRIAARLRRGGPREFQVQRLTEALSDPSTGLTYMHMYGDKVLRMQSACLVKESSPSWIKAILV